MAAKTVIRPAAEADIPAILALYRQLDSALVAMQPEFFCESPREEDEIRKAVRADGTKNEAVEAALGIVFAVVSAGFGALVSQLSGRGSKAIVDRRHARQAQGK